MPKANLELISVFAFNTAKLLDGTESCSSTKTSGKHLTHFGEGAATQEFKE